MSPVTSRPRALLRLALAPMLLVVLAAPVVGCGGDEEPEERLAEAGQALTEARSRVQEARERVAEKKEALAEAEKELESALGELREAEAALAEVEKNVDVRATDKALFRAIQKRLLEDEELEDVAIAVRVEKGVVTLIGEVPDARLRDRAIEIARSVPGVAAVESRIDVAAPGGGSAT